MADDRHTHNGPRLVCHAAEDFRPTASIERLRLRAELLRAVRDFFHARGFLEVETPLLCADTVVDRHLDPFAVDVPQGPNKPPRRMWLQTSPEFCMKRLLAVGSGPIFQVARAFRQDEFGPLHNPEFTIVEWYRPGDDLLGAMQLTSELCHALLRRGPAELLTYAHAFQQFVGIDPHRADSAALARRVAELGVQAPQSLAADDRDGWLDLLLSHCVSPRLGIERPVLLYHYPTSQAALAKVRNDDPPVAERFELYVSGVELANGYQELCDPDELRRRMAAANAQRRADGKPPLPEQSRLLEAMRAGLPAGAGVALGFDRLVMLAAGANNLAEVLAFPFDRA